MAPFIQMKPAHNPPDVSVPVELEVHFTPKQISEKWGTSVWTIRRMLAKTPGIVRRRVGERSYMLVPARVLAGLHRQLSQTER